MLSETKQKDEMLSLRSTVQEILRALYFYRVDYLMAEEGKRQRLLHKDQLVALLEQGNEGTTLEELFSLTLKEPLAAKMQMEEIPQRAALLLYAESQLSKTTFEAYRERKISRSFKLPDWWGIPLPLLYMEDESIFLNEKALALIPGGTGAFDGDTGKLRNERIIVLHEDQRDRTLSLSPLTENAFFLEDISGDFEMAEDLVWWAAAGRALVRRMEENGLSVRRCTPYEAPPEKAVEVISCPWDGELVGRLVIQLPEEENEDAEAMDEMPSHEEVSCDTPSESAVSETRGKAETSCKTPPHPAARKGRRRKKRS